MNAQKLALLLHFRAPLENPTEAARGFLGAMPAWNGSPAVPDFEEDETVLAQPRAEGFETRLEGIGVRNDGVVALWSSLLTYVVESGACTLGLTCGFHPDVATVWPYLHAVAESTTRALRPVAATLGGLGFSDNKPGSFAATPVPRVFAPWTYVSLAGLPAALADGLRALPAANVRDHADGLVIEAVRDPHAQPDPAFVRALEALPLTPRASYRHLRFPTPGNPV